MPPKITRFVEMFSGSSFPTRTELSDGRIGVVKLRGAGNGSAALMSELIVNRLAQAAGLPVPGAFVVDLAVDFPWEFGTDEFQDLVRKSPGSNLGLTWIDSARPLKAEEYNQLPHEIVSQIVTLDLAFNNWDRPLKSGNLLEDRARRRWIVDHGSCRFLFQSSAEGRRTLPSGHAFAGWEEALDARWLQSINPTLLTETVNEIPEQWLDENALTRDVVREKLESCLRNARDARP